MEYLSCVFTELREVVRFLNGNLWLANALSSPKQRVLNRLKSMAIKDIYSSTPTSQAVIWLEKRIQEGSWVERPIKFDNKNFAEVLFYIRKLLSLSDHLKRLARNTTKF